MKLSHWNGYRLLLFKLVEKCDTFLLLQSDIKESELEAFNSI